MLNKPEYIIVHHTAVSHQKNPNQFEAVNNYHKSKGWGMIGYHKLIEASGEVKRGREDTQVGAHCFDEKTEILTNRGWLEYNEVGDNEVVATFNKERGVIEYQKITEKIVKFFNGNMISISGKSIDVLCTENHRILYRSLYNYNKPPVFHTKEAKDIYGLNCIIPVSSNGIDREDIYNDSDLALAVFSVADGNYSLRNGKIHCIRFKLKKIRKIKLIKNILDQGNIKYTHSIYSDGSINIKIYSEDARRIYSIFPDKKLTWDVLNTSIKQKKIILNIYCQTDGHKNYKDSYHVFSTERQNIDVLQALCLELEKKMTIGIVKREGCKDLFTGSITNKSYVHSNKKNYKKKNYSGKIWCVSVPNYYIVVRRNGKVVISGNTKQRSMNLKSIGICLTGHFDIEYPTEEQKKSLLNEIRYYQEKYSIPDSKVVPHRFFAPKSCWGSNLPDDIVTYLTMSETPEWAKEALKWNAKHGLMKNERPNEPITRAEQAVINHRLIKLITKKLSDLL